MKREGEKITSFYNIFQIWSRKKVKQRLDFFEYSLEFKSATEKISNSSTNLKFTNIIESVM